MKQEPGAVESVESATGLLWGRDPPLPEVGDPSEVLDPPIPLGAFDLHRLVGSGGSGLVYQGRHREQGVPAAVKVMMPRGAADDVYRKRFYAEARSVAALDHRHIVSILDFGAVDAAGAEASAGLLAVGSPYLVMELAAGGSLPRLLPLGSFAALRAVLEAVLLALAHAHARGVIHRDIKPGNILVQRNGRSATQLLVADFGIAHVVRRRADAEAGDTQNEVRLWRGRSGSSDVSREEILWVSGEDSRGRPTAGTPAYMAPEQIHGDQSNQGPWTDLYAVGCLAYQLATGQTPFQSAGPDLREILKAHLRAPVPQPRFRFPTPPRFGAWLQEMLRKAPWRRPQRAADALRALKALGDPSSASHSGVPQVGSQPMEELLATQSDIETLPQTGMEDAGGTLQRGDEAQGVVYWSREEQAPIVGSDGAASGGPAGGPTAPSRRFPRSWRSRGESSHRPVRLVGVGLGLFGLRPVPFVGRYQERDQLWRILGRTQATGVPHLAILRGSSGVGKSRLAEWLLERAEETGWGEGLILRHGAALGLDDPLARMLSQTLRCDTLPREKMLQQVVHVLSGLADAPAGEEDAAERLYLSRALVALMTAEEQGAGDRAEAVQPVPMFDSPRARLAVIWQLLRRKSRQRPILLWLDDVQWGGGSLDLVEYLMMASDPAPVLVVMTAREDPVNEDTPWRARLAALATLDRATELSLTPLAAHEQLDLILGMLSLEPELALTVRERAGGNPLFAVQLVRDWVDRGSLEDSERGYRLRPGDEAHLPDDLHGLWQMRLERLASRFSGDVLSALELAAAQGSEVNDELWEAACRAAGVELPEGLRERLVDLRLAEETGGRWRFAHNLLSESLERSAREAGRWVSHHLACARAIGPRFERDPGQWAEALGEHLISGERPRDAVHPLLRAAERRARQADYARALALLETREAALAELGLDPGDVRYRQGWVMAARIRFELGEIDAVESLLDRAEAHALGQPPDRHAAELRRVRASLLRMRGRFPEALAEARRASALFADLGDSVASAACDLITARLHFESTGDHGQGLALAQAAEQRFREVGSEADLAEAHYVSALLLQALGDEVAALHRTEQARQRYRSAGNRFGEAVCENFLGEVARQAEAFAEAEHHYRRAIRILESVGSQWTFVQRMNLVIALVQDGHYAEAEKTLDALEQIAFEGRQVLQCYADFARLACAAADGRWRDEDRYYEKCFAVRPESGRVDRDLADMARLAGREAAANQQAARARRALRLALLHYEALGDREKSRAVMAEIKELGASG